MCGRNSLFPPALELERQFDAEIASGVSYRPRYNIAPGASLEVITNERMETIDQLHWGLLPHWAETPSDGFINARSETADRKPAFEEAWAERPCLILSSGFYEWQQANGGPKQPYRVHHADRTAFAMAGLWNETTVEEERLRSVTILTTEPNELLAPIHDRMPMVLPQHSEREWLEADPTRRTALCRPYPDDDLSAYPISTRVNNPTADDATIIEPAERTQSDLSSFE